MKNYAILYNFTGKYGKGTDVYELQANNMKEAKEKFYKINKGYISIRIKDIKELR
jgi:hypothetical protein